MWRSGALVASLAAASAGCGGDPAISRAPGEPSGGRARVVGRADGRYDVFDADTLLLAGAAAEALVERDGERFTVSTRGCAGAWAERRALPDPTATEPAAALTRECTDRGVTLALSLSSLPEGDAIEVHLELANTGTAPLRVWRLTPALAGGDDGGLFLGAEVSRHRILDDGNSVVLDVEANLHLATANARQPIIDSFFEVTGRGAVLSNWNHAITDLDSGRSWVAGAGRVERAAPTFGTTADPDSPRRDAPSDRTGFAEYAADQILMFDGKELPPGGTLSAEPVLFVASAPSAHAGLERWASWVGVRSGRPLEPSAALHVPTGWNSWTGSGFTGGLGTDIDEALLDENLQVMAREFAPFGVEYFQIDDGYQVRQGEWEAHPQRFPSGLGPLVGRIEEEGLRPGFWVAAFRANADAQVVADHPDWFLLPGEGVLGAVFSVSEDERVLDLSNDAAIEWLEATIARYRTEWRTRWLKLDFAYFALTYRPRARPELTAIEAYRRGLVAVRDALGDDAFYLGIAVMGPNFGVVDGMRLTLDDGPKWEQSNPFSLAGDGGSFKSTVKTGAKRWYFHGRTWVNHHDLLFFRTSTEDPDPPVTFGEAITLASFMGVMGSIVKFGEDLRQLTPEQIQLWRKLLPPYPASARPRDVFEREYPELYDLDVRFTLAAEPDAEDTPEPWKVIGILNWGRNFDWSGDERLDLPDEARRYPIDLHEWGLDPETDYHVFEFWSQQYLGRVRGRLEREVAAHGHEVLALRRDRGVPMFLGHDRHWTQGGTDLAGERWDAAARALEIRLRTEAAPAGAAPHRVSVKVHVPGGDAPTRVEPAGVAATMDGEVLTLEWEPAAPGVTSLRVSFPHAGAQSARAPSRGP
ncbi:MAG: alpha-galactosidase [Polyangiaceae bacterium]|nr:alpha-galactosidase [Polyangiaceae bacterium]